MQKRDHLLGLLDSVRQQYGDDLSTPKGFLCLSLDIRTRCGKSLSMATIKRVFGYVKYNSTPSADTLNILANYLGYSTYDEFCAVTTNICPSLLVCGISVKIGDILEVCPAHDNNHKIRLRYKGDMQFQLLCCNSL
ncbi:MAG: hypothetical protein RR555_01390 [Bacteroidales bacterium]